jgi:hypothetical protein
VNRYAVRGLPVIVGDVTHRSTTRDTELHLQSEGWNPAQKNLQQILVF